MYDNFARAPADVVEAGDICALTGIADVSIGETLCDPGTPTPLPTIEVRARARARRACAPGPGEVKRWTPLAPPTPFNTPLTHLERRLRSPPCA